MTTSPEESPRAEPYFEERGHLLARLQGEAIAAAEATGHTTSAVDDLLAARRDEAARDRADEQPS